MVVVACVGGALLLLTVVAVGAVALINRGSSGADDSASGAEPPEWDATLETPEGMGEDDDPLDDDFLDDDEDEDAASDSPEGSTVQPGDLEFTFESLDTDVDAIEATRGEFTASDRYVIVAFEVENLGDDMVMYFHAGVTLVDTDGVEYSSSTEETTELRDLGGFSHNMEPGDGGLVEVVFDIPEDAEPYYLEVTDDGTGPSANMSLE
ncbi:DUF4352 domain-containing protein [Nocardiopsis oceani]